MENLKSFSVDLSGNYSSKSEPLFKSFHPSDRELHELTSTFEELTIDLKGMVKELLQNNRRDTDSIRRDFIRNGIDSAVATHNTCKQPPPGFRESRWPLANLENRLPIAKPSSSLQLGTSEKHEIKSNRRKRSPKEHDDYCVFCYNNHEEQETYLGHSCRDEEGFVLCPKLRKYVCPYCQATGDTAHTKKYCPKKPIITPDDLQTMASPFVGQNVSRRNRNNGKRSLRF